MAGSGQEAITEGLEWSGGLPGGPVVFGRPSQRAGSGGEALPEGREAYPDSREAFPEGQEACPEGQE